MVKNGPPSKLARVFAGYQDDIAEFSSCNATDEVKYHFITHIFTPDSQYKFPRNNDGQSFNFYSILWEFLFLC